MQNRSFSIVCYPKIIKARLGGVKDCGPGPGRARTQAEQNPQLGNDFVISTFF